MFPLDPNQPSSLATVPGRISTVLARKRQTELVSVEGAAYLRALWMTEDPLGRYPLTAIPAWPS